MFQSWRRYCPASKRSIGNVREPPTASDPVIPRRVFKMNMAVAWGNCRVGELSLWGMLRKQGSRLALQSVVVILECLCQLGSTKYISQIEIKRNTSFYYVFYDIKGPPYCNSRDGVPTARQQQKGKCHSEFDPCTTLINACFKIPSEPNAPCSTRAMESS